MSSAQILAVMSSETDASSVCEGSKRIALTSSVWPLKVLTGLGSPSLHNVMLLSAEQDAKYVSATDGLRPCGMGGGTSDDELA